MLGGEPASGTGTLLRSVMGSAADELPATTDLGSTAAVKEAVHAGLGISLVLQGAAAADREAGRLHTLTIEGLALRKPLWVAHRTALVPQDPAALFVDALTIGPPVRPDLHN